MSHSKNAVLITLPTIDTVCGLDLFAKHHGLGVDDTEYYHLIDVIGKVDAEQYLDFDSKVTGRYKELGFPSATQAHAAQVGLAEFSDKGVSNSKVAGLGLVCALLEENNGHNGGTLKSFNWAMAGLIRDVMELDHKALLLNLNKVLDEKPSDWLKSVVAELGSVLEAEDVTHAMLNFWIKRYLEFTKTMYDFLADGGDCFPVPAPTRDELRERTSGQATEKRDWGVLSASVPFFKTAHPEIAEKLGVGEFGMAKSKSMFSLGGYLVMLHFLARGEEVDPIYNFWVSAFAAQAEYKLQLVEHAKDMFWGVVDGVSSENHLFDTDHGMGMTIFTDKKIAKQIWRLVNRQRKPGLTGLAGRALEVLKECPGIKGEGSLARKMVSDPDEFLRIVNKYVGDEMVKLRLQSLCDLQQGKPTFLLVVGSDNHMVIQCNYGTDVSLKNVVEYLNEDDAADWHYEDRHGHDMAMTFSGKVVDKDPSSFSVEFVEAIIADHTEVKAA